MYEMFLGPIEMSKPWDTKGIEGVHRFLKKLWRLYFDEQKGWIVEDTEATEAELRIIHKTIKKVGEDIERFAFNTAVSQFMICVNELSALNCHKRIILEALSVILSPFAPHMAEELWHQFKAEIDGVEVVRTSSVMDAPFPAYEEKYIAESVKKYPVAINGKTRTELEFPADAAQSFIEAQVLADETVIKWLEGRQPKKIIFVQGRMVNVVI
jgi:leucyl-tRNA synthetase